MKNIRIEQLHLICKSGADADKGGDNFRLM